VFSAGTAADPSITFTGDTNTGLFSPAADTIAFAEGGAEAMRIDSSGNVLVGATTTRGVAASGAARFEIEVVNAVTASFVNNNNSSGSSALLMLGKSRGSAVGGTTVVQNGDELGEIRFAGADGTDLESYAGSIRVEVDGTPGSNDMPGRLIFSTTADGSPSSTERARITSGGDFLIGKTAVNIATDGVQFGGGTNNAITETNDDVLYISRLTSDGILINFRQDSTTEGTISVSGNTVSYNAFSGGHWTQLQEGRGYNPDIPRGTVMSSIGEMAVWKSVEWTETIEHPATEEKEAWTESIPHRETYLGNLDIGATFEEDGFTKTVVDDGNERLPKVKISDVVGDKAVYGVFQTWDKDEDMLITSLGAFVVRIAAGVTVEIGDLLESNGDGCAKVQDDDIIRSKTIGKVTSTIPTDTYDDGSYTVPCVIYCG
jgi:hypothetical protein